MLPIEGDEVFKGASLLLSAAFVAAERFLAQALNDESRKYESLEVIDRDLCLALRAIKGNRVALVFCNHTSFAMSKRTRRNEDERDEIRIKSLQTTTQVHRTDPVRLSIYYAHW